MPLSGLSAAKPAFVALFFLFVFISPVFGESANSQIAAYLEGGETFTKQAREIGGKSYYLVEIVSLNGSEDNLIFEADGDDLALVLGAQEIREILFTKISEENVSYDLLPNATERDLVWAALLAFNDSRSEGEARCAALVGMDRFPCFDLDSCWRACYTPVCQPMKIGSGAVFLGYARDMYLNMSEIDRNLGEARERLYAISDDDPGDWEQCNAVVGDECNVALERDFLALFANIRAMREAAGNNEGNPIQLKEAVGFCFPMGYEYNGLINASAMLTRKFDALEPLLGLNKTVSDIHGAAARRSAMVEGRSAKGVCEAAVAEAGVRLMAAKAKANRALSVVSWDEVAGRVRALEASLRGMDCSDPGLELEDVLEFNATFSSSAALVGEEADAAAAAYGSAEESLSQLNATVDAILASSPDSAEARSLAENVSLLYARMAMPSPQELPGIGEDIAATLASAQGFKAQGGLSGLLVPAAATAVIAFAAAVTAVTFTRRKRGGAAPPC
ncbi:MAG: hypothetical protein PHF51_03540 [Candidatus ainarchaeum sp.]|nr:hypothetical protein [Candidatus ainarchaeum sp.]